MRIEDALLSCIDGSYNRKELKKVIECCYSIALSYLKMKASSNSLYLYKDESLEDLAWDFIADLFHKNDTGSFIKLSDYFEVKEIESYGVDELEIELRKLVFTKVDDNIFRHLGEKDPSLKKIIRNIKLAVRNTDCSGKVCYKDGLILIEPLEDGTKPALPSEFMQMKLCSRLCEKMQIPEVLIEVIDILQCQDEYRKEFPLVSLASIIRESFILIQEEDEIKSSTIPEVHLNVLNGELNNFIEKGLKNVSAIAGSNYIKKGKIDQDDLHLYLETAKDILRDEFGEEGSNISQYDHLKKYLGELEYENFRENHRPKLEYIVKLARNEVVDSFRKDWMQ